MWFRGVDHRQRLAPDERTLGMSSRPMKVSLEEPFPDEGDMALDGGLVLWVVGRRIGRRNVARPTKVTHNGAAKYLRSPRRARDPAGPGDGRSFPVL